MQEARRYIFLMEEYTSQRADLSSTEAISPGSFMDVRTPSYRSAERTSSMSEESISARGGTGTGAGGAGGAGNTGVETSEGKQMGKAICGLIPTWLGFVAGIFYHMVNDGTCWELNSPDSLGIYYHNYPIIW